MKALGLIAAALGLAAAVLLAVFTFGMRTKSAAVLDPIRKMNRAVINPRQHDAGTPGASASLVRHVGRTSGAAYATPIVAEPTEDGFVIALPYGTRSDWTKNVVAAGRATLVHDGSTYELIDPEIVPIAVGNRYFSTADRWTHRVFGVTECLRLRTVDAGTHAPSPTPELRRDPRGT